LEFYNCIAKSEIITNNKPVTERFSSVCKY